MRTTLRATGALMRGRDVATAVLTVVAFALPHALLLCVAGGVGAFWARADSPVNRAMAQPFYLVLVGFAAVLLVVPILSMGAGAARLGLLRRSRDLAVMRLLGLPPAQAKVASVCETLCFAAIGIVLGSLLYAATLPAWSLIRFQGVALGVGEMWVGPIGLVAVGAVMVALAGLSGWMSMRRVAVTPLGVVRRSAAQHVSAIGVVVAASLLLVWIVFGQVIMGSVGAAIGTGLFFGTMGVLFALVNAVGAWSIGVLGHLMARVARSPQALLAGRRVADDPKSVWRSLGGLSLVAFIVGVLLPMIDVVTRRGGAGSDPTGVLMFGDIRTGIVLTLGITVVLAAVSTAVNQSIRLIDDIGQTRALVRAGAPAAFLDSSRRLEIGVPAGVTTLGGMVLGIVFISPVLVAGGLFTAATLLGWGVLSVVLILAASECTRPLRARLLAEPVPVAA